MSPPESAFWSAQRVWIIGCGDVGFRLARRLSATPNILGFRRHPLRVLPTPTFQWFRLDLDVPLTALPQPSPSVVYYLSPPPAEGLTDSRITRFLTHLPRDVERFVYVSTTAVYGDQHGAPVDETTPCTPTTDRGKRRLDAEQHVQRHCNEAGIAWNILRVPGIYGPDRLPIARLKAGAAVPDPADTGPGNRIHVADLVSALMRIAENPVANEIFNISDQNPVSNAEFLTEVANQLRLPSPSIRPLAELKADLSAMQASFLSERRLIVATKLFERLKMTLEFSDYKLGIQQALEATPHLTKA